jgi:glutathione S-transferase
MPELILHQYAMSPFSEKVRKVFAVKKLGWRAVEQPMWNPKPQLVPLTGGYRRIPVLQVGADVYCDTARIIREIEARHPDPTVYPTDMPGAAEILAWFADQQVFRAAAVLVLATIGKTLPPEFRADREKMIPGLQIDALPAQAPHAQSQFRAYTRTLARQLDGRDFLLGRTFCVADAAAFQALWFARLDPGAAAIVAEAPTLTRWFERVEALGHGAPSPMSPEEALAIAKDATPTATAAGLHGEPGGARPGDRVTVTPDDYAFDPVAGELVAIDPLGVAIRRRDPAVGEIVVHFPRAGYRVAAA